jgi:hypothetical protein
MCGLGGSPCEELAQCQFQSQLLFSINAADNISASTLTPHGGRAIATGEMERN